jgi:protein-L-isoaspartate(D-aspartate) O-methyltransferase
MNEQLLTAIRQWYAEEIKFAGNVANEEIVEAFAKVPREKFLGQGPWSIPFRDGYRLTEDSDPRHVYHNIPVAIDVERQLNNGQPSWWAGLISEAELKRHESVLHIGCGTGYYTAILAAVVGSEGHVTALEVDDGLRDAARSNLSDVPHEKVESGNFDQVDFASFDAIIVSAGATHVPEAWIHSLRDNARLILPLTIEDPSRPFGRGKVLKLKKLPSTFEAKFVLDVMIYHAMGLRDRRAQEELKEAMSRGGWEAVRSLRQGSEAAEGRWLSFGSYYLSTAPQES